MTPQQELRLAKNPNYTSFSTGKPAHLDNLIWKWYGDADLMIAGFKAGEVDFATDLQDSDIPKVQDLGDQVSAIPALLYEFLRPNWSEGPFDATKKISGCSRNAAVADRGTGCPMADPAMRQALSYAIDKNEINTRLLGGTVQVANTNISPGAWFFADQTPATFDPEKAKSILDAAGWKPGADGIREKNGLKAKIELCTTTRQVRHRHAGPDLRLAEGRSASRPSRTRSTPRTSSPTTTRRPRTPRARSPRATSTSPSTRSRPRSTRSATTSATTRSQFEPDGANDAQVKDTGIDAALDTVKNSVDFAVIKDAMAEFQKIYVEKTVEIPLYYRKNVDLVGPKLGNFFANPTQAGPTWNAVDWYAKS